ncbi:hypothetical protein CGT92_18330 [Vibrio metoecus]|uniref:hypothetical protein n=1 Tax=Vibrio metoecus TaxID=1481663 RepID=UPI0006D83FCE|nr:hypothetical protein [Vibrio metoecus]KQB03444.1 hypothetical protein XV91_02310 [Vibrio metoecus]PAR52620.1 hypothetical protein CGT92_18330 [Vibrio metoecus]
MIIIEGVASNIITDLLKKIAGAVVNSFKKEKFTKEEVDSWDEMSRCEIYIDSNYLDYISGCDSEFKNIKFEYFNRSSYAQVISLSFNIAPINGPLHGPLQTVYMNPISTNISTHVVNPGSAINTNLAEIISMAENNPVSIGDTSIPIYSYPQDSLIYIDKNIPLPVREALLDVIEQPYNGIGISILVSVRMENGIKVDRFLYGGFATIDDVNKLHSAIDSKENVEYKYLNMLLPFKYGYAYRNNNLIEGDWFKFDNLKVVNKDSSQTHEKLMSECDVHIIEILKKSITTGLYNVWNILLFNRKGGEMSFHAESKTLIHPTTKQS